MTPSKESELPPACALQIPITGITEGAHAVGQDSGVFWIQSDSMTGFTGLTPFRESLRSYGCLGVLESERSPARLFAALDLRERAVFYEMGTGEGGYRIEPKVETNTGERRVAADEAEALDLIVWEGPSLSELLRAYGRRSGERMGARLARIPVHGWCSWYWYYGRETEEDILAEARGLRKAGVLPPGSVILIDDGWNLPSEDAPRNWGDWWPGEKFPRGMKALADDLHGLGFRAGLWLAPFAADGASALAREHPDWLIHDAAGGLLEEGANPVCGLDLSHPEVLAFIESTFRRVFDDWGFDYVKLDFLMYAMADGPRHDPTLTRSAACREALRRIRAIAGDRFVLACGSPLGPAVGLVDAMRVGFDVGSRWEAPMFGHIWPHGNCSIKPAAVATLHRQWMDGCWWRNDPDCLVVRDRANEHEPVKFDANHPGGNAEPEEFGLSDEEAGLWARLVYCLGTLVFLSESYRALPAERRKLIDFVCRTPPPNPLAPEFTGQPELLRLREPGNTILADFNLSDAPVRPPKPADLPEGIYREPLSGAQWNNTANAAALPEIPAHAARVWRLAE